MRKLLVANWKENPSLESKAIALFTGIARAKRQTTSVVVCPPFVYLEKIAGQFRKMSAAAKKNFALGAQDTFWEEKGAFTGAVGPKMLRSLGTRYVIVGHSERRRYFKETDATINKKIKLALRDGLNVILCAGESQAIRKKGIAAAEKFVKNQLKKDLNGIVSGDINKDKIIIAYEPIWAIGTGKNDTPADAVKMAQFVKKTIATSVGIKDIKVLYGGSANSKNIADFVQYKEIGGALVGGASLKTEEFGKMIKIVTE
jgi:triosephosphate isomerase